LNATAPMITGLCRSIAKCFLWS